MAIRVEHGSADCKGWNSGIGFIGVEISGPSGHGKRTPSFQRGQRGTFCQYGTTGDRVVELLKHSNRSRIITPAFDSQGPLPYRWQKLGRIQPLGDVPFQSQPMEARRGEHDRVKPPLEGLIQSRLDIAPERRNLQVGTQEQ